MKRVFKLLIFLCVASALSAQSIDFKFNGKANEFALIKKRKLAVQKLEVERQSTDKIVKWNSNDAGWTTRYKDFVTKYNEHMKAAFEQYWNLSTAVEFKTKKEIEELYKKKDKTYFVVVAGEVNEDDDNLLTLDLASAQYIQFNRAEKGASDNFFRSPIPYTQNRKLSSITYADCAFTVRFAMAQIDETIEQKATFEYKDVAEDQNTKNCKIMIRERKLMVDKDLVDAKLEKKTIKETYKRKTGFDYLDFNAIDEAVKTGKKDAAYIVSIPVSYFKAGGLGSQTTLTMYRFIIDVSTGAVLEMHKNKPKPGVDAAPLVIRDFEEFNKDCDGDSGKDDDDKKDKKGKDTDKKKGKKNDDEEEEE